MDLTTVDRDALRLARSIGLAESAGKDGKPNYRAVGDNGTSKGAYQFQQKTWENYAQQVLGDRNAQMTPTNQDKVAYGMVKKWKDAGKRPEQVASMWNAGEGRPDAYKSHRGTTTINGKKIQYDTPAYTQKVKKYYMGMQMPEPTPQPEPPVVQGDKKLIDKVLQSKVAKTIPKIFPGGKVGEAIGTLAGYGYTKMKDRKQGTDVAKHYDVSGPTPLQVAGDVAQGALMLSPMGGATKTGLGLSSKVAPMLNLGSTAQKGLGVITRLGKMTAYGTAVGTAGALKEGVTDPNLIKTHAMIGGAFGLATGGFSEVVRTVSNHLPERIVKGYMNTDSKTAQKLLKRGVGTPKSMLKDSNRALGQLKKGTSEYKAELYVNRTIKRLIKERGAYFKVGLVEFVAALVGGLPAGAVAFVGEGIVRSPAVIMPATGMLQNLAQFQNMSQSVLAPYAQKGASDIANKLIP